MFDWLTEQARAADAADPFARTRALFDLDDGVTYLDGNSLGALPRAVPERAADVVRRQWGKLRIRSWSESGWWQAPERIGGRIAPLVGADPGTVVVGDSTSINVFRAVIAAARLAEDRSVLLVDRDTFPTDGYLAESAARLTGMRIRRAAIVDVPSEVDDDTAVVLLNHVDYRTGRLHDMAGLTTAAHDAGARIVWDLSHSAGVLPVELARAGVDLAVGCSYKFLNGGPGAPSYLYVAPELLDRLDQPLPGWCSHQDPFGMAPEYAPAAGITKARGGTPEILSLLTLDAALDVWDGVDLAEVRRKSLALTEFFAKCVVELAPGVRVVTPMDQWRGSQVSVSCVDAEPLMGKLIERGVVGDHRSPDILRFGFAPLYNTFGDALHAARELGNLL